MIFKTLGRTAIFDKGKIERGDKNFNTDVVKKGARGPETHF